MLGRRLFTTVMALSSLALILTWVGVPGNPASARRGGMEVRTFELTATLLGHQDENDAYGNASAVTDYRYNLTAWGLSVSGLLPNTIYYEINRFDTDGWCDDGDQDQLIMIITTDGTGYFKTPLGVVAMAGPDITVGNYVNICRDEEDPSLPLFHDGDGICEADEACITLPIFDGEVSAGGSGRSKPRKK